MIVGIYGTDQIDGTDGIAISYSDFQKLGKRAEAS